MSNNRWIDGDDIDAMVREQKVELLASVVFDWALSEGGIPAVIQLRDAIERRIEEVTITVDQQNTSVADEARALLGRVRRVQP